MQVGSWAGELCRLGKLDYVDLGRHPRVSQAKDLHTTMRFPCSSCSKTLQLDDIHEGKRIHCPACQALIQVPQIAIAVVNPQAGAARLVTAKPIAAPLRSPAPSAANRAVDPLDIGSLPPAPMLANPTPHWQATAPRAKRSKGAFPVLPIVIGGSVAGVMALALGVYLLFALLPKFSANETSPADSASADAGGLGAVSSSTISPRPLTNLPNFPNLGPPRNVGSVTLHTVDLGNVNGGNQPGFKTKLRVYLPQNATTPSSIACVLVAPAGTNLLQGNEIDAGDYHDECLPYALAGMAVINYSIDGPVAEVESFADEQAYLRALSSGFQKFIAAEAGVTNGRVALEYALAKLPQVDPARIYCAGHSSAATLALQLAAAEPRIAKAAAYAPITDLKKRFEDVLGEPEFVRMFPGIQNYTQNDSPVARVQQFTSPVFLFHARDDSNEPWQNTNRFNSLMRASGKSCKFETVDTGQHYQSMIDEGIPRAIRWFRQ